MKYAVIRTGGKQYRVSEGDVIDVERLEVQPDQEYTFTDVLLYTADDVRMIGAPLLADVAVKATVIAEVRGEKIRVSHFKAKARYRKTTGHRQTLTQMKIKSITTANEKPPVKAEIAEKKQAKKKVATA